MAGIVKILTEAFLAPKIQSTGITRTNSNPFAQTSGNPFVSSQNSNPFANYGQNKPVAGGYFAGYYNGKQNIVGRKLFVEV